MRAAIIVISFDYMGRKQFNCAWDGDVTELADAERVLKKQAKERWAHVMYSVTETSVTECYRKRGSSVSLNAQQIEDAKNYMKKFSAKAS
jgi:hypothetical protein